MKFDSYGVVKVLRCLAAATALVATAAVGIGCHDNKPDPRQGRVLEPSKQAPSYASAKTIAIDPALRGDALRELEAGLHATDPEVRAHSIEGLEKAGAEKAGRPVIAALADPEPIVRYAACMAAGNLQLKDAHEALLKLADDKDAAVRVVDRYALHRLGDYRYSHELEQLSRDPEPRVRGTTAMVLGMLGDPSALKVLRGMRLDMYPAVRQQAAAAMWQLGSEQGMKDLIGWSLSRFPDDEMMGFLGLAEPRNRQVIQHVRNGLTTEWPEVNLTAARAMGLLGSDEGYGLAQQGAKNTDPRQRIEAAMAFGAIGRSDAQGVLRSLLHDTDPNVRIAAASAILQLKREFIST